MTFEDDVLVKIWLKITKFKCAEFSEENDSNFDQLTYNKNERLCFISLHATNRR